VIVFNGKAVDFADLFGGEYGLHEWIITKAAARAASPARRCTNRPFFQDI
jgi:hypothetical protein